ncbi:MAG: hypothetical protein IOD12_12090 [Silvanigrellales bacterium]|nr:hypothetical protein [Silvanigrellales bacterium]
MLQSVLANLKNIKLNSRSSLESLSQLSQLVPENLRQKATQAVNQAVTTTEGEIQRVAKAVVDKVIEGRDDVTEEVKAELASIVTEFHMSSKDISRQMKGTGHFLLARLPRSLEDVMNLRSSVALGLMSEAQSRIAARRASEVTGKGKHKHEAAKHEAVKHEAVKHEATKHEAAKHEAAKHDVSHEAEGVEADHPHLERGGRRRGRGRQGESAH